MLPGPSVHATVSVSPYPILTVTRNNTTISEDGGTATFTITASRAPVNDLTVSLVTGGTYAAAEVTGLQPSGTTFTATLKASTTTVTYPITANHDTNVVNETVTLAINTDPSTPPTYTVGIAVQRQHPDPGRYGADLHGHLQRQREYRRLGADGRQQLPGRRARHRGWTGFAGAKRVYLCRVEYRAGRNGCGARRRSGMTMGSANIVLYAMWTLIPTYSVTYNGNGSNGGTVPTDGTAYHTGDTATILPPGTLSQSGSVFAGWNTAQDSWGTTYSGGSTFAIAAANVVLYAIWLSVSGTTITSVPLNATNVVIPEGITGILNPAFQDPPNLVSVTLPSTLTSIPVQAFLGCPQMTTLVSNNARYQVLNGALVDTQTWTLMLVPSKLGGNFAIPAPVVSIDPYAFDSCTNIISVVIPASLTAISMNGFSGLRSPIPVVVPSTVTSIAPYAFYNSSVTSITVPPGVTTIGASAMAGCPNLSNVFMQGPPPTLSGQCSPRPCRWCMFLTWRRRCCTSPTSHGLPRA